MIEIPSRYPGQPTVYRSETADTTKAAAAEAVSRGADLSGADLSGADLSGAKMNWQSHDLIAELLRKDAGMDIDKRKAAGLVLVSRDWCWERFLAISDPLYDWALDTLAGYVTGGDREASGQELIVPVSYHNASTLVVKPMSRKGDEMAESVSGLQWELAHEAVDEWDGQDDCELLRLLSEKFGRDVAPVKAGLLAACERFEALDIDPHATEAEWGEFRRQLNAAITKARAAGGKGG